MVQSLTRKIREPELTNGRTDERMDGRTDERTNGRTDERTNVQQRRQSNLTRAVQKMLTCKKAPLQQQRNKLSRRHHHPHLPRTDSFLPYFLSFFGGHLDDVRSTNAILMIIFWKVHSYQNGGLHRLLGGFVVLNTYEVLCPIKPGPFRERRRSLFVCT